MGIHHYRRRIKEEMSNPSTPQRGEFALCHSTGSDKKPSLYFLSVSSLEFEAWDLGLGTYFLFLFSFFFLLSSSSISQNIDLVNIPHLVAGPIQGHTTSSSVKIWLLAKEAKQVTVELSNQNEKYSLSANADSLRIYEDFMPGTFSFEGLKPGTNYEVSVTLNKREIRDKKMISIKTLSEESIRDFSFLLGSCAFMPSKLIKPFYPRVFDKIYKSMEKTPADLMLWLGDNLYYRPKNYSSVKGMYRQQIRTRKFNQIDNFMKSLPQYAIWDDHDYGNNDSDENFPLKDSSLAIHKKFWPNPFFGTIEAPGTFSNFRMYDCEFFLLDNRFYRTPPETANPSILGEKQLEWFLHNLKSSVAVFKFVAVGTQMLNENTPHERYVQYTAERKKIFDFIKENKIQGVIFLTGDIHHSVLMKSNTLCDYPVYDFTCSPLTSVVHNAHSYEYENPLVVKDKIAITYNFGKISVTGKEKERKCITETYSAKGEKLWDYTIHQNELR